MISIRLERLRAAPLVRPLSSPDFRTFWLGEPLVSSLGDQISLIALTWLALELTGSGVALGLVLTATAIPRAILMLVGGVASDRWSPRSIMLVTNAVRGVVTTLLGLLVLTGGLQFWELIVLAGLFGVMDAFFFPASGTIVPGIVGPARLEAANALSQGTMQLMGLIGPALGGIIVAAFTTAPAFLIDAVTFGVAVLALLRVRYARPVGPSADPISDDTAGEAAGGPGPIPSHGLLATIGAGFRYAWDDRGLRAVLLIIAAIDFAFAGSVGVGVPWLADTRFGGPVDFGLMLAGWSGGALVGAGVAGSVGQLPRLGTILIGVLVAMGLGLALVGVAPLVGLVVLIMAAMGVGGGFVNVLAIAWLQRRVDPAMLGRVMSLVMLFSMGLAPISYAISGPFVQASPPLFFLAAGLIVVAAALAGEASGAPAYFEALPEAPTPSVSVAGEG
jgi:MFS family permease